MPRRLHSSRIGQLGKISVGARNLYGDEQLDIAGAGEKVRKLIEEHVYSTGIDPKIPPVDLLAADYEEQLNQHKSPRSKASEIEYAIRQHIKINAEEDPEYYKRLSERLEDLIKQHEEKWDELVQLLLDIRDTIESEHVGDASRHGLSPTEFSFYNILIAELRKSGSLKESQKESVKTVIQSLVQMFNEASEIVDFFNKWDEQKRVKREIKRVIIANFDESLVKPLTERFWARR